MAEKAIDNSKLVAIIADEVRTDGARMHISVQRELTRSALECRTPSLASSSPAWGTLILDGRATSSSSIQVRMRPVLVTLAVLRNPRGAVLPAEARESFAQRRQRRRLRMSSKTSP